MIGRCCVVQVKSKPIKVFVVGFVDCLGEVERSQSWDRTGSRDGRQRCVPGTATKRK